MKEVIPDSELMKIPIRDNNEKLVNLREYSDEIVIEIEKVSKNYQNLKDDECYVRETVAEMLAKAQKLLPEGFRLKIIDAYRPMSAQKKWYNEIYEDFQKKNPKWTPEEVKEETDKWIGHPDLVPFHTTGGAVDLTVVDKNRKELDMGTPVNAIDEKSNTYSDDLTGEQKENRQILINAMEKAGFINYPHEWWHWGYGDRYWAAVKETISIYNGI